MRYLLYLLFFLIKLPVLLVIGAMLFLLYLLAFILFPFKQIILNRTYKQLAKLWLLKDGINIHIENPENLPKNNALLVSPKNNLNLHGIMFAALPKNTCYFWSYRAFPKIFFWVFRPLNWLPFDQFNLIRQRKHLKIIKKMKNKHNFFILTDDILEANLERKRVSTGPAYIAIENNLDIVPIVMVPERPLASANNFNPLKVTIHVTKPIKTNNQDQSKTNRTLLTDKIYDALKTYTEGKNELCFL